MTDKITAENLQSAVEHLRFSERGTQAGKDFAKLVSNGGSGLDSGNWHALELLCRACRFGGGHTAITLASYFQPKA